MCFISYYLILFVYLVVLFNLGMVASRTHLCCRVGFMVGQNKYVNGFFRPRYARWVGSYFKIITFVVSIIQRFYVAKRLRIFR